jgi:hypothetical protein
MRNRVSRCPRDASAFPLLVDKSSGNLVFITRRLRSRRSFAMGVLYLLRVTASIVREGNCFGRIDQPAFCTGPSD